jgi:hypothetical protein
VIFAFIAPSLIVGCACWFLDGFAEGAEQEIGQRLQQDRRVLRDRQLLRLALEIERGKCTSTRRGLELQFHPENGNSLSSSCPRAADACKSVMHTQAMIEGREGEAPVRVGVPRFSRSIATFQPQTCADLLL